MFLRLPFRCKPFYYISFALLLGLFQLLDGSDPYCVLCIFFFILIAGDAFNRCEGFKYASGSYVFFGAMLTLIVGVTWKTVLWQPVDRNMLNPQLTFGVYTVGMAGVWVAAVLSSRLRTKAPFLKGDVPPQHQMRAALGCLAIGLAITFMGPLLEAVGAAAVATALQQLNALLALGVMVAVYYQLLNTGGEQSFSKVAFISALISFVIGVAAFSKQAMFTPFVAWALSALAAGYRTTVKHLVVLSICAVTALYVLVPYSQYGRSHPEEFGSPVETIVLMATNPSQIIQKAEESETAQTQKDIGYHFYDQPQGFFDRLTMLSLDDALIGRTDRGYARGWNVVTAALLNIMPRFVVPNKQDLHLGNSYAHEIGVLADSDLTTGVSFSPFAEAFHLAGWTSLLLLIPGLLFVLFWIADSSVGSLDDGPWALIFILNFAHTAPEGGITGTIYTSTYGFLSVVFAIFIAVKVAPLLGSVIMGPENPTLPMPVRSHVPSGRNTIS